MHANRLALAASAVAFMVFGPAVLHAGACAADSNPSGKYIVVEESVGQTAPLRRSSRLGLASRSLIAGTAPPPAVFTPRIETVAAREDFVTSHADSSPFLRTAVQSVQDTSDLSRRINELLRDGMLTQDLANDLFTKLGRAAPAPVSQALSPAPPAVTSAVAEPAAPVVIGGAKPAAEATYPTPVAAPVSVAAPFETPAPAYARAPSRAPVMLASAEPIKMDTQPLAAAPAETWVLTTEDRTIRNAFERWAREANWMLSWEYPSDFQIQFNAEFTGDLVDAVGRVIDGLSAFERPIRAEFYGGNRVLRIVSGRE